MIRLMFKMIWYSLKIMFWAFYFKWATRGIKKIEPMIKEQPVFEPEEKNLVGFLTLSDGNIIMGKCYVPYLIYEEFIHNAMESINMKCKFENGKNYVWNTDRNAWFEVVGYEYDN